MWTLVAFASLVLQALSACTPEPVSFENCTRKSSSEWVGKCLPLKNCTGVYTRARLHRFSPRFMKGLDDFRSCGDSNPSNVPNDFTICCRPEHQPKCMRTSTTNSPPPTVPTQPPPPPDLPVWLETHPNLALLPAVSQCGGQSPLVFRGIAAAPHSHPWMVRVGSVSNGNKNFFCGGSIITRRHILTAAHCVNADKRSEMVVRLGEHDVSEDEDCEGPGDRVNCSRVVDMNVEKIIPHPEYENVTHWNDIALIRLAADIEYDTTASPICLPIRYMEYGVASENKVHRIVGWGQKDNIGHLPKLLQEAKVHVIPFEDCRKIYKSKVDSAMHLCALGDKFEDTCLGDSGGPLELLGASSQWTVVGVVSMGYGCGSRFPGVYTDVHHYIEWLLENLSNS